MLLDFIDLSAGTSKAAYRRLFDQIKQAVQSGVVQKGERFPSIREAAEQLGVSRTTVENAYLDLCMAGIAESRPQKGYYCIGVGKPDTPPGEPLPAQKIRYDLTARKIDPRAADTDLWKKTVREVLRDTEKLTSYGDPQGEKELREALAAYAYQARGVHCAADQIVIGAGLGPLLQLRCGLTGRNIRIAMENSGFSQAEQIFCDYGIPVCHLAGDQNGASAKALLQSGAQVLFLLPSALSKISVSSFAARRGEFVKWARASADRFVVEDDYNGELRYTARSVTAFQPILPEKTVYIGSFSKLLLPSVRIAYMVLPGTFAEKFSARRGFYHSTCGKAEQLALAHYVESGALEKHLRRLRKLYSLKSRRFCSVLKEIFPEGEITLFESSLSVGLRLPDFTNSRTFCEIAEQQGIKILPGQFDNEIRLSFAGLDEDDFRPALECLQRVFSERGFRSSNA